MTKNGSAPLETLPLAQSPFSKPGRSKFPKALAAAGLALALAACGEGGGGRKTPTAQEPTDPPTPVEPEPTAYKRGLAAINAATTPEAAQAAYDAVDQTAVNGEEAQKLRAALASKQEMLRTARAANQRTALMNAAGMIDTSDLTTRQKVAAARAAIARLQQALDAAANVSDADKAEYRTRLNNANRAVGMASAALDIQDRQRAQRTRLTTAVRDARTKVNAVNDTSDQDVVTAADDAIAELEAAIEGAADLPAGDTDLAGARRTLGTLRITLASAKSSRTTAMNATPEGRKRVQRERLTTAVRDARTKVGEVNDTSADDVVTAADNAIAELKAAIKGATDLDADDTVLSEAKGVLATLEGTLASAKTSRTTAMETLRATAEKLYGGIGSDPLGLTDNVTRTTAYGEGDDNANKIAVTINGVNKGQAVNLSPTELAVPDHPHGGWEGKQYTAAPEGGGTYEARVYSNIGKPTESKKFASTAPVPNDSYQYQLSTGIPNVPGNTEFTISTDDAAVQARVASPSFDQSAGRKTFDLTSDAVRVLIPGTFHGVSGTYGCTPTDAKTPCSATVAARGFTLEGGTWSFKASNNEDRVTSTPDAIYVSYGWWLHKAAGDGNWTASAFVLEKGTVPDATGLTALNGTATYMGGAVGKYALYRPAGGTNDAGHFTARATLNANFTANTITGTIDHFRGADGQSRDWSVELKEAAIADTGGISRSAADDTVWTIGSSAADASGTWSGTLQDNGTDDVPKVGTGTFHTTYGTDGRMVGAFGVNRQQ